MQHSIKNVMTVSQHGLKVMRAKESRNRKRHPQVNGTLTKANRKAIRPSRRAKVTAKSKRNGFRMSVKVPGLIPVARGFESLLKPGEVGEILSQKAVIHKNPSLTGGMPRNLIQFIKPVAKGSGSRKHRNRIALRDTPITINRSSRDRATNRDEPTHVAM